MGKKTDRLDSSHIAFIGRQKMFFSATATAESHINLSPKGLDTFRVLDEGRVAYLDLTGRGNEAAAHIAADGRMTIMFCAFEGPPLILRIYGRGQVHLRGNPDYLELLARGFEGVEPPGTRQIIVIDVEMVLTSCGFGVPHYQFVGDRPSLPRWAEEKGEEALAEYRRKNNTVSLDGLPVSVT